LIRVWVETASSVTRAGLEALIESADGIEVVESMSQADVVLADQFPKGYEGAATSPAVVLSDERLTARLVGLGVRAVLPREAALEQIVAALYAAAAGLIAVPVETGSSMIPASDFEVDNLTPRELEVLEMLAEGLSNKQIAAHLNISEHTAKFHVNSILNKLSAGTRTEAVMRALRRGLLRV
jgi:DNA-binding NarL/FixJ family response regulator